MRKEIKVELIGNEDGVIDELFIKNNDQVENGALLMVIKN